MRSRNLLVSIIIPVYNAEKFLEEALDSCLQQTYQSVEVIGIDNNSTDNSRKILFKYARRYPDKIRVFSEPEPGAPAARNKGLKEAKGEYICFLDSDDALIPKALEHFLKYMQKDIDATCGGEIYCFSSFNREPAFQRFRMKNVDFNASDILYNHPNTGAILLRKSSIKKVTWNNSLKSAQELVYCVQLCIENKAKFYFFPEPVCKIRIHNSPSRISNQGRKLLGYNRFIAILKIQTLLKSSPNRTQSIEIALNDYILKNTFMAVHAGNFRLSQLLASQIDKKLIRKSDYYKKYSKEWVTSLTNHYVGFLFHFFGYTFFRRWYERSQKGLNYQHYKDQTNPIIN